MKRILAVLATTALMVAMLAMPASAQPVVTGGLVNVTIVDFADVTVEDVTIQVPVAAAVNICPNVDVEIITEAAGDENTVITCDARARSGANQGGGPNQGG